MKPRVLVTGANGYTGRFLSLYYAERGYPTRGMYYVPDGGEPDFKNPNLELVPGDLRNRDDLERAVEGIEIVQNVAALYRPTNVPDAQFWAVNADGIRTLVEVAAAAGVRRFVQCSTIGIYGDVESPPAAEDAPIRPLDSYQESKLEGERIAMRLGPELGMETVVVRPAGIYGPDERRFLKLAKAIHGGAFVMFGDGDVPYHFSYIHDLCEGMHLAATRPEAVGEDFILADAEIPTLNDIVDVFAETLGKPRPRSRLPFWTLYSAACLVEFGLLPLKPLGVSPPLHRRRANWFRSKRAFDISKARRLLGYQPNKPVREGLAEMVRSYVERGWL